MERPADSAEHSRAPSSTHDVAIRESAPPIPRSVDQSRHPSLPAAAAERMPNEIWTSAISRLQAQVSYNTGMLESHRRQLTDIESAITRMHQEMNHVVATFNDVRAEIRAQPAAAPERPRNDPGDLEVLAGQLQRLTNRVNEIDGLAMQMDLMRNRMKRLEGGGSAATPVPAPGSAPHVLAERPAASSAYRDAPMYDAVPPPPQPQQQQPPPVPPPPHQHAAQHPPLPPMRTTSIPSSEAQRPASFPAPMAEAQISHRYRPSSESRPYSSEAPTSQPPVTSAFRPGEALPPPSALSGWRPAEAYPPGGSPHQGQPLVAPGFRPQAMEPESHGAPTSGWAAVNTNPAIKRPPEEIRSPYESPLVDGAKRPKLAPLMPRSGYGEEAYVPSQYQSGAVTSNPSEASGHPRSRAPSDGSQPPSHPVHTPAQQALQHNFRFITSTQQAEPQEPWRFDPERSLPPADHGPVGPRGGRGGRGRGRGGRGRGGRGRGGAAHAHHGHHGYHGHHGHGGGNGGPPGHPGEPPEHGTPEWENPERVGPPHGSPNGHHHPDIPRGHIGFVAGERNPEFPATPVQQPSGPYDPYAQANLESSQMSSGKKTRTKPIRNAEGILIRKDGRPDMRSVSSANNLRKVHAKKEAERAGMDDDDDMTRSGTPTSVAANEHEEDQERSGSDAQERHRDLMGRIFPQGMEGSASRVAEQFFPKHEEASMRMKTEESERDSREGEESRSRSSHDVGTGRHEPNDVVMQETSEAQAEDRAAAEQDTTNSKPQPEATSQERQADGEERGSEQA